MEIIEWLYNKAATSDDPEAAVKLCEAAISILIMRTMIQEAGITELPSQLVEVIQMYEGPPDGTTIQ